MHRGYIKLWRKVQKNFLWKEKRVFSKAEAWIDILMEVRHSEEPETIIIKNKILKCYYAESLYSLETWADRWNWTRSKVKRFLVLLSSPGCSMIVTKSETVTTRLKVINYDVYAGMRNADETEVKRKRNASETQVDTNKNVKNVKNEKNKYSVSFSSFWNEYPVKKGKGSAYKSWIKKKPDIDNVLLAIKNQTDEKEKLRANQQFCPEWPHPTTWLNQERWDDEEYNIVGDEDGLARFLQRHKDTG